MGPLLTHQRKNKVTPPVFVCALLTMSGAAHSPSRQVATTAASPARPASASPRKLQVYEEPQSQFGTSPRGSARQKQAKLQKFSLDHVGMDVPNDDYLREMFDYFDTDKSGSLDAAEFKHVYQNSLENFGAPLTDKDLSRTFARFDKDKSGRLSYDEFCVLMLSRLKA